MNRIHFVSALFLFILLSLLTGCSARTDQGSGSLSNEEGQACPTAELQEEKTRLDGRGIEQVYVPAGKFLMGTSKPQEKDVLKYNPPGWIKSAITSELPQHEVCITTGFWIDKYEVTNAAFQAFVDAGGYDNQEYWSPEGWQWRQNKPDVVACSDEEALSKPDHPCNTVTWYEAQAYANWRGGKLPTEAEWEYAARGPQSFIYPWGNEFNKEFGNIINSSTTTPVGSFPQGKSWVGAMDMAGNVMEWVQDWLDPDYYTQKVSIDPQGPETGIIKIEKGGWWGSSFFVARSAYRHFEDRPNYADWHIGFRIVSR